MASKQSKAGHAAKVDPLHAARTQGAAAESAKSLTHSLISGFELVNSVASCAGQTNSNGSNAGASLAGKQEETTSHESRSQPLTAKKTNVDDDDAMLDDVDVSGSSKVPHKKTIKPAEGVQQNGVPDGAPMMESDSNYHADEEDGDELDDDVYVMHVSTNWDGTLAGSWWSDFGVRLYDLERGLTTAGTQVMLGHEDRVTGLSFGDSHNEPHAVFTCAEDGVAAMWDRRTGRMEQKFRAPLAGAEPVPFLSIDVGAENSLLAAGTDEDEESRLLFWDRRAARPLGSYEDSHYEGITQIRFNPMRKTELATAGLDGLVCYFDIRQRTEEDALVSVLNAESPVSKIGFFGPSQECLYCLTHSETLHLFHAQKAVAMAEFPMIRERLAAQGMPSDFLIDCAYVEGPPGSRSQSLLLVSGDHTGTICLGDVTLAGVQKLCTVQSNLGHKKDVRSVAFLRPDPTTGVPAMILSGGEDGLVCEWTHAKAKRGPVRRGGARRKSRR